jgi:exonuclease SbcC
VLGVAGNHDVQVLPRLADSVPGFGLLGRGGRWEVVELRSRDGGQIRVAGWSFPAAQVRTSPLADGLSVAGPGTGLLVGLLHCDRDVAGSPYAPVRSAELEAAPVDAWLLGHIHRPGVLSPPRPMGYLGSLCGLDLRTRYEACEEEVRQVRGGLLGLLARYGEAPDGVDPSAEIVARRLDRLSARVRNRDDALRAIRAAKERISGLVRDSTAKAHEITRMFADLGLEGEDEAGLRARLEHLSSWQALSDKLIEARGAEAEYRRALALRDDLIALVDADDEGAIQSAMHRCREIAEQATGLADSITEIRTKIAEAGRQRRLEDARAQRQAAEDMLVEQLEDALFAEAGTVLLDQVEQEHVQTSRPAVLRRAEDWFSRFTRHHFALEFLSEGAGRFAARELATGERRSLAQLSSGTRVQLLLAVRVAFALEVEQGREPMPIFLDEALTTADPERFHAAAESMAQLAEEQGRQLIYLTSQPGDVAHWRSAGVEPTVLDLPAIRGRGRAIEDADAITLPAPPREPPKPGTMSAEDYAVVIRVPPIEPWERTSGIHLFHLLRDDLELLWKLMRRGVERLGHLQSLLASPEAGLILDPRQLRAIRRRMVGAESWIEGWRQGRGQPVDRAVLCASGAISARLIDRVSEVAGEVQGSAGRLLEALRQKRVAWMRSESIDALEQWLSENGYLPAMLPVDSTVLGRRVYSAMAVEEPADADVDAEARSLSRFLAAGVAAGCPPVEQIYLTGQ